MTTEKFRGVKAHTQYKLKDGTKVPGVTTVLGVLAKPALIHWAWKLGMEGIDYKKYRDKAANIGTLAHLMAQCSLTGEKPDLEGFSPEEIDRAENSLLSFYEWQRGHDIQVLLGEQSLVSETYGFGGTCDIYGILDGLYTLVDLKTGSGIYKEYYYQLSAYRQLLVENGYPVHRAIILNIPRKETEEFEQRMYTDFEPGWAVFLACKTIYDIDRKGAA